MVSVIGMRTHPWRGANSLDLTSGLGRIYVESSDRQHSGTQGSGTHVLRRVSKSVPTIAGICVGDRVRFPCTKQLGRRQEVSTKVFERHKEDEMAIPKYADPDRGPYQSGEQQTDHEKIHIVKNPLDAAELQTALDNVHRAGMPGVFGEVRDGGQVWRGAAGVTDVSNGRPVTPDMRHRTLICPLCVLTRPCGATRALQIQRDPYWRGPFTAVTRVRIPSGTPNLFKHL